MRSPSSPLLKTVALILLSCLAISWGIKTTSLSSNKWNLVKDKHHHAERNFIFAERKPTLTTKNNSNTETTNQNNSDTAIQCPVKSVGGSHSTHLGQDYSTSSKQPATECGIRQYVVTLRHGSCSRQIVTQV
jgi:hypothetical protein